MSLLKIKEGSQLDHEEIDILNKERKEKFNSPPLGEKFPYEKDIFFLLLNEQEKILAFGKLVPLELHFFEKCFNIWGISSIISLKNGQGFGKELVLQMKQYAEQEQKGVVGFCHSETAGFYEKCNFKVVRKAASRFVYQEAGQIFDNPGGENVIYIDGVDQFMNLFVQHKEQFVYLPRMYW